MAGILTQLPSNIQNHIRQITKQSGLSDSEESYEKIASAWKEKEKSFLENISAKGLKEVKTLSSDDQKGGVALTYSGSLVLIGPLNNGLRKAAYHSIGLRKDVPDSLSSDNARLSTDIHLDQSIQFETGPIQKTSPIYKFAVCDESISLELQEEALAEATIIITNDFIDINKGLIPV